MRPARQNRKEVDYCELAGMSTKTKSRKGAKLVKSDKSGKEVDDLEIHDMQFQNLKEVILKEAEEGLGPTVTDTPLPLDIDKDDVFEAMMKEHEEEKVGLDKKKLQLERRQKALDTRKAWQMNREI